MARRGLSIFYSVGLAACFGLTSPCSAQIELGDFTINGAVEVGGMPSHRNGSESKLEEYRDLPETIVVPQLNLVIERKKKDYFFEFDSTKPGRDDQNYQLRFGKYGLFKFEFEWDQIPHIFNNETARTPYDMHDGNYTLPTKPANTNGTTVRDWVNDNAKSVDLSLLNRIGKLKVTYTPTPGWTFTGSYGSQNVEGKRAFGTYFGPSPGSFNITELAEPIDYQTHNIEFGGEYAGDGWTLGLKYNGSLFHNSISTLTWDNPLNPGIGGACTDEQAYNNATGTGPCRGRLDLYPSNQAHNFSLTGTASLPFKTNFMGTFSYGWRLQNDRFLPFTINSAITQPSISARSLDGDVRPMMANVTFVNNFFTDISLKTFYRYYDFDNRSRRVRLPDGIVVNDEGAANGVDLLSFPYSYAKQNLGFDGSYNLTHWLTAKLGYVWERMHREIARELLNSNEHIFGPTFDIKPNSWMLFRLGYKRSLRDAPGYDAGRNAVVEVGETRDDVRDARLEALRKFDEAARNRDKFSFFTQYTPFQTLTLYGGFDFNNDDYPRTVIGVQKDIDYAPSIGFVYAPLDWLSIFGDYNWERFDWRMQAIARNTGAGGCPDLTDRTPGNCPAATWRSRGNDEVNTVRIGSDMQLIKNLLNFRVQYGFSLGSSSVHASGNSAASGDTGVVPATNYPTIVNHWHEVLTRLEYSVHKNLSLRFGYYFNGYASKDHGVDIMKLWMGDVENPAGPFNNSIGRSIFLGDNGKGPYSAHIGFLGLMVKF